MLSLLGLAINDIITACDESVTAIAEVAEAQSPPQSYLTSRETMNSCGNTYTHIENCTINITINKGNNKVSDDNRSSYDSHNHTNNDDYYRRRDEIEQDARMKFYRANSM